MDSHDSRTPLAALTCEACRSGAPQATDAEIAAWSRELPDWRVVERDGSRRLERVFRFPDFAAALAFTSRVGALAESAGHHPAIRRQRPSCPAVHRSGPRQRRWPGTEDPASCRGGVCVRNGGGAGISLRARGRR
jgi:hypothetical protein